MRQIPFHIIFFVLLLQTITSCQSGYSLGEDWASSSFKNVYTDTCTVNISTVYADSLETLGDSACQIGYYSDEVWGKVQSSYIAEFSKNSFTPDGNYSYAFDSITVRMKPSGEYWGDTLTSQKIDIYSLKEPIEIAENKSLYNRTQVAVNSTPIGSFSFRPHPGRLEVVEARLPDEFGKQFFQDILDEKSSFDSQEAFREYFPGLAFKSDALNKCITGFEVNDSSVVFTIHYHQVGNEYSQSTLTYQVNQSYAFTQVQHDRSSGALADIEGDIVNAVPSSKLNHRAYMQGLTGFYNLVDFPYLNDMLYLGKIVSVESATLILCPVSGTYGKNSKLPSTLHLYTFSDNNVAGDGIYDSDGTTLQTGNLQTDDSSDRGTYYSFDITSFLQGNIGNWGVKRDKLYLNMSNDDFTRTFRQVIFNNDSSGDSWYTKLNLRIKIYSQE